MLDHIPFRKVSNEWRAHIDTNHKRCILVCYELDNVRRYISIIDDNTVPLQMIHLTAPESLSSLRKLETLASDAGLLGFYGDVDSYTKMAVIWNPTIGKSIGIYINLSRGNDLTIVGFGVCHFDPKLVEISVKQSFDGRLMWDVDVFSLSTRDWRNVHRDMQPSRLCKLECAKVCINGVIYFRAYDLDNRRSNFFISFNLERGEFGEVPFPKNLEHALHVHAAKVHDSLGILHYHDGVCDVWTKKEGANETFNRKCTVEVEGQSLYSGSVLEFMNNGEVLLKDDNLERPRIEVYDPFSEHNTIGIYGTRHVIAMSYMETAYLSDQPEFYIPFDVQSEIIKWLPEKSLLRFRTVSKAWKAHIDKFHSHRRLLVCYESNGVRRYAYFIDGNNFPQMIHLTAPESLRSLRNPITLASDAGLIGFCELDSRVVIWNPTVQKSVSIDINPNVEYEHTIVGFGVCHGDLKLVKISVIETFDATMCDVDVFSRSTKEWRNVHWDEQPVRRYKLECSKVCLNGVIYFRAYDLDNPRYNFFISFNLEREEFGVVPFPENLEHAQRVHVAKVHDSLGILHHHDGVCDVWTKKEGANETFNMKYVVEVKGRWLDWNNGQVVLEFMSNGGVVLEDDDLEESRIQVYDPSSRSRCITIRDIGIHGTRNRISARSYKETEYLSDQPEPHIFFH